MRDYIALFAVVVTILFMSYIAYYVSFKATNIKLEMFLDSDNFKRVSNAYDTPLYNLVPSEFEVYLINLDRNKDRLAKFTRYYNDTDLQPVKAFKRVQAVDGKKINPRQYVSDQGWREIQDVSWYGYRTKHNQLTVGAVGCYLSHMNVYKMIRDGDASYGIVFEDDVRFVRKDVYRQIRNAISMVPNDWDFFLLGCVCQVCNKHPHYQDLKHFFLMHAYVIKKESAAKVLGLIEHMPIRQQIDSELSTLALGNKIKVYCVNKWIVAQDNTNTTTTIQTPLKMMRGVNPFEIPLA